MVESKRDLMGSVAIFRKDCVAALHPRKAFLTAALLGTMLSQCGHMHSLVLMSKNFR